MRPVFGVDHCTFDRFNLRLRTYWKDATSIEEKERISRLFGEFAVLWRYINEHFQDRWLR